MDQEHVLVDASSALKLKFLLGDEPEYGSDSHSFSSIQFVFHSAGLNLISFSIGRGFWYGYFCNFTEVSCRRNFHP